MAQQPPVGGPPAPAPTTPGDGPVGGPPSPVPWDQQEPEQPEAPATQPAQQSATGQPSGPPAQPAPEQPAPAGSSTAKASEGGLSLVEVRRLWPDIVDATKTMRRLVWMLLTQHAQVVGVEGDAVTIGFDTTGPRESFAKSGGDEVLRQAAIDVVGQDWRIEAIVDPGSSPGDTGRSQPPGPPDAAAPTGQPVGPTAQDEPGPTARPGERGGPQEPEPSAPDDGRDRAVARAAVPDPVPPADDAPPPPEPSNAARSTRPESQEAYDPDQDVDPDDPESDAGGVDSAALLERTLGAKVIDEIPNE